MDSFSQPEDPPGHSIPVWINLLGGTIAFFTVFIPLYITVSVSSVPPTPIQIAPQTAQRN